VCITAPFKISNFDVSSDLLVVCPPVPWLFTTDKDVPHYQLLSEIESFGADSEGELCGFGTWVPLKVNASALALNGPILESQSILM
jgi:hypothetical protein